MNQRRTVTIGRGEKRQVSFISRYRDENDYLIAGPRGEGEHRVHLYDGAITDERNASLSNDDIAALAAYLAAEDTEYQEWRAANPHLVRATRGGEVCD